MSGKSVKTAEKHLCRSAVLPGPSWMSVNVQGAFIQRYTVVELWKIDIDAGEVD